MLYVGIDWASEHHDIFLTNDSAQTLAAFRIAHASQGFERLHRVINEHQPEPQQVLVALEPTRGLLVHDLLRSGYQVYAINPKAVRRYKDRHVVLKAKTDIAGCFLPGTPAADRPPPVQNLGFAAGRLSALGPALLGSEKAGR